MDENRGAPYLCGCWTDPITLASGAKCERCGRVAFAATVRDQVLAFHRAMGHPIAEAPHIIAE
jgi:hypothetical protein